MHIVKTLHVLGAVLFLGNIAVSAVWKVLADRSGRLDVARYAARLVLVTDAVFTAGGAALVASTGHLLAPLHGGIGAQPWLQAGYALFAASGLIWLVVLLPVEILQARMLSAATGEALPAGYRRLSLVWSIAGTAATAAPLGVVYLMAAKPALGA